MVNIHFFTFNPFQENTYLLWDDTKECCIIDPGCYEKEEENELFTFIEKNGLKVRIIVNTHSHIDHVLGVQAVKVKYNAPFAVHTQDETTLKSVKVYAPSYGFHLYKEADADFFLKEEVAVTFGNTSLDVLFVPGHAPGHVAFYHKGEKFCICGDTLFKQSIGRTDLPGGNHDTLIKSIKDKLYSLDDDVTLYPGHGPSTTIAHEKKFNPYVRG